MFVVEIITGIENAVVKFDQELSREVKVPAESETPGPGGDVAVKIRVFAEQFGDAPSGENRCICFGIRVFEAEIVAGDMNPETGGVPEEDGVGTCLKHTLQRVDGAAVWNVTGILRDAAT